MYRSVFTLAAALVMAMSVAHASAATIATWPNSAGTSKVGNAVTSNTTAVNLTRGPGISANSGGTFNSRGWTQGGNLSTAINNNDYYQFGVTLDPNYEADFTQFTTRLDRSNTGPPTTHLLVSNDNFATFTDLGTNGISATGATETWNFNVTGLTGTILFRIYGYGATSSAGTMDFENTLVLSGSEPRLIPEPASFALLTLGGALIAVRRRHKA